MIDMASEQEATNRSTGSDKTGSEHDDASTLEKTATAASDRFEKFGRLGWAAKGGVYALIGALFVQIAIGTPGSDEANQAGAVEAIAERPAGSILLMALGVGLALYATWRLFTVVLPGDWTGRALLDRAGYMVSVIVYASLLFTLVGILRNRGGSAESEDRMVEGLVKDVLAVSAGRTIVIAAGLATIVVGVVFAHKGWSRSFRDDISGDDGIEGTLIDRLGTIGWIARGVSMAIIGAFLIRAAWMFDPEEAAGLDDSVRQLAGNPLGAALAAAVGLGFVAYGAFAGISARHRDLEGPTND